MSDDHEVYVLGCGGHAKVVIQTLSQLGLQVNTVFDDDCGKWDTVLCGRPVVGPIQRITDYPRRPTLIAVGDNRVRQSLDTQLDLEWLTAVHPHAFVDPSAHLGPGAVVFAGVVIQADVSLGRHVIVNTGASIDHDCRIEDFVHIAPGVRLAGNVQVGERSLMGIGSAAIPGRSIGPRTIVGAGAVVITDLPSDVTAVGVPARAVISNQ